MQEVGNFAFFPIFFLLAVVALGILFLVVILASRRHKESHYIPRPPLDPSGVDTNKRQRTEILKQLAEKDISKEEAEERLSSLTARQVDVERQREENQE
jgi:hypothetical protein